MTTLLMIVLAISLLANLYLILEVSNKSKIVSFFQQRHFESERKYWAEVYNKPSLYSNLFGGDV